MRAKRLRFVVEMLRAVATTTFRPVIGKTQAGRCLPICPAATKVIQRLYSHELWLVRKIRAISDIFRGLEDWELCVMDLDCATATVRRHMWKRKTDCNGDGVVTCEDFALIHRHGHKRCSEYLDLDGGSMFMQHRPCLRAMPAKNLFILAVVNNVNIAIFVTFECFFRSKRTSQEWQHTTKPGALFLMEPWMKMPFISAHHPRKTFSTLISPWTVPIKCAVKRTLTTATMKQKNEPFRAPSGQKSLSR